MEGLLKRAVVAVYVAVWGTAARLLGPSRRTEHVPRRFHRVLAEGCDRRVDVLFVEGDSEVHVLAVINDTSNRYILVNPGRRMDIRVGTARTAARFIRAVKPLWRVTCLVRAEGEVDTGFEPNTCVLVVRALLGIDEPMVSYPEQLLNYLWEAQHGGGRSNLIGARCSVAGWGNRSGSPG